MDKVRLNNFILWCKNWYQPINNKKDIITEAQKILTFDNYSSCNNPISIALCYIDELVDEEIVKYMSMYNVNYHEALLYRIRNFFAFECKLPLNPPIYSRKLYRMGFVAPTYLGNSYKLANYKANKIFNKK